VQHRKEKMKNITLKIDDETYSKARVLAAKRGTSISAMVREFLNGSTKEVADQNEAAPSATAHEKRVAQLTAFFAEMDAKAKTRPPRTDPFKPMTREEIYAERLR
jgi:plasmid stability protein